MKIDNKGNLIKEYAGVWIDHEKAIIGVVSSAEEIIKRIKSKAGRRVKSTGGARSKTPYGPHDVADEKGRERKYTEHLEKYYDEVISQLEDMERVFIFGPGEAKSELNKRMLETKYPGVIYDVEPADKMTDRQILAKIRKCFIEIE